MSSRKKPAITGDAQDSEAMKVAEALANAKRYLDQSVGARKESASNEDKEKYPLTPSQKHSLSNYGYHALGDLDNEYSRSEADLMFADARKHYNAFQKDHGKMKPVTIYERELLKKLEFKPEDLKKLVVKTLDDADLTHYTATKLWRLHSVGLRLDLASELFWRHPSGISQVLTKLTDEAGQGMLKDMVEDTTQPGSFAMKERQANAEVSRQLDMIFAVKSQKEVPRSQEEVRVPLEGGSARSDGICKRWHVYCIRHKETKKCYIGQATDLAARWKGHKYSPPRKMTGDIEKFKEKYGGGVERQCTLEVLGKAVTQKEGDELEAFFIKTLTSSGMTGYNDLEGRASAGGKRALAMPFWRKKKC